MTPAEWSAVKEILSGALGCPPAERSTFLDNACQGDPDLRRRVEALVEAAGKSWGLLEVPAAASSSLLSSDRAPASGDRIGAYEIQREIGHGGMGIVYLARRADAEFQRSVAIKIARAGLSGDFERRFRAERQIVANLDHPHIARLLDGGATPDGRPYLVMEYVEGQPLTQWCDAQALGTRERLEIFLDVCAAVQYAHQHLVVHRDLKPGNILVTREGGVKLLDFGIAKLIDPDVSDGAAERTGTLMRLLTPDYASPEQVRGAPISTASDVYALGVVLFELLAGKKPYELAGASPPEMLWIVCEREPPKPSAAAKPDRSGELEGDLDTIVLTALRKEPGRRFASAAALAQDIRRHLSGLPVEARVDSLGYRAGKFVRRHRAAVAAAAFIALALAGGLAVAMLEARRARAAEARAERRFNDVRQLANSVVFELHDQIRDLPGSTPARQVLVRRATEYLDRLAKEKGDDRSLIRELAAAYGRVADVQGNPYQANLGDLQGSASSYRKALDLLVPLTAKSDALDEDHEALAGLYLRSGGVQLALGRPDRAVAQTGHGVALRRSLFEKSPNDPGRGRDLATALRMHAYNLSVLGRQKEATEVLAEQARILRNLLKAAPADETLRRELGQNRYVTGLALDRSGDQPGAIAALREAIELQKGLVAENPNPVPARRDLYWSLTDMGGVLLRAGDLNGSDANYEAAMDVARVLERSDLKSSDGRTMVAIAHLNLGGNLARLGQHEASRRHRSEARAALESLLAAEPSNTWLGGMLAELYLDLAEQDRPASAADHSGFAASCELYRKSDEIFSKLGERGRLEPSRGPSAKRAKEALAACSDRLARASR